MTSLSNKLALRTLINKLKIVGKCYYQKARKCLGIIIWVFT